MYAHHHDEWDERNSARKILPVFLHRIAIMKYSMQRRLLPSVVGYVPLLAAVMLNGCQKQEPAPQSSSLKREVLMGVAFPGWQPVEEKMRQMVVLPMPSDTGNEIAQKVQARVEPIYVVKLDEQHAVMLTHSLPLDDSGELMVCHACSNYVGAYFFTRDGAGWRMSARQDSAARVGLEGYLGKTEIVEFGRRNYAFAAEWASCWQGTCGSWLVLLGLKPDQAKILAKGIPTAARNTGSYPACDETTADKSKTETVDSEPEQTCFEFVSTWKPSGERMTVHFRGMTWGTGKKHLPVVIDEVAIYRIENGKFTLETGKNPVPKL